jgi:GT2 family glycosyltransferase
MCAPRSNGLPTSIGSFSASTLCVKRDVWRDVGGYPDWYEGFGGEEASFDLMCWSKGYEVWTDPNSCAYHYSARAAARGYDD